MTADPRIISCARAAGCLDRSRCALDPGACGACLAHTRDTILRWLAKAANQSMIDAAKEATEGRAQGCAIAYTAMCTQVAKDISQTKGEREP